MYSFLTDCVSASNGDDINDMADMSVDVDPDDFIELAEELEFKDFILKELGYIEWAEGDVEKAENLLKEDFGVNFFESRFQGIPTLYIKHSSIEYIFVPRQCMNQYLDTEKSEERIDLIDSLSEEYEVLFYKATKNPNYKEDIQNFVSNNKEFLQDNNISLISVHLSFSRRDKDFIEFLREQENTYLEPLITVERNNIEEFLENKKINNNNNNNKYKVKI